MKKNQSNRPILRALQSVIAAMFGVQSEANMEKDFQKKSPATYIIIGIIMTVVFVYTLLAIVNHVIT